MGDKNTKKIIISNLILLTHEKTVIKANIDIKIERATMLNLSYKTTLILARSPTKKQKTFRDRLNPDIDIKVIRIDVNALKKSAI